MSDDLSQERLHEPLNFVLPSRVRISRFRLEVKNG
jgi:hypothetical protein